MLLYGEFSVLSLQVSYLLPAEAHHKTHHSAAGDEVAEKLAAGTEGSCTGFWDWQRRTSWKLLNTKRFFTGQVPMGKIIHFRNMIILILFFVFEMTGKFFLKMRDSKESGKNSPESI